MGAIVLKTIVPILLLIGAGFLARKLGLMKSGDGRVLNAYIYYFALPALLLANIVEIEFDSGTLRFMAAGIMPVLIAFVLLLIISRIFSLRRDRAYLIILSTIFGSWGFFGIPFIMFAFPTPEAEKLATLSLVSIAVVSVAISIMLLEYYKIEQNAIRHSLSLVLKKLARNPLILSILLGLFINLTRIEVPSVIIAPVHMLGSTTATVALFVLGVFLYGRDYSNLLLAFRLSLLRIIFLPAVALLIVHFFRLTELQRSVIVIMHAMPVALSMIVLSERYDFRREEFASLILLSSLAAGIYLNLWLLILGYR